MNGSNPLRTPSSVAQSEVAEAYLCGGRGYDTRGRGSIEWLPALMTFEQAIDIAERLAADGHAVEGESLVAASLCRLLEQLHHDSSAEDPETERTSMRLFHVLTDPWVRRSRICRQARMKPHGYAGDYKLIHWIHGAEILSEDVVGRGLDRYFVTCAAAHAVRNRRSYLVKKISEGLIGSGTCQRVVNVAAGPGAELYDLARLHPHVELVGLDHAAGAIEHMQAWIANQAAEHVTTMRLSAAKLLNRRYAARTEILRVDAIFSGGVFDYLRDESAIRLIANLYEQLKPGGRLVIGNFKTGNPSRHFMEWILDWHVLHRSRDDMARLMTLAGVPTRLQELEEESLGVNMFAVAYKE